MVAADVFCAREVGAKHAVASDAQDGLWFLNQLIPDSTAHHINRAYQITGGLRIGALRAAWRAVLQRHEALRTTLVEIDGRLVQRIADEDDNPMSFVDLSGTPPQDRETQLDRFCADWADTPFDLAAGPPVRSAVVRLSVTEHVLLLALHQAVADDRSVSVLVEDLSAGYAAEDSGRPAALPALASQYADYAREQRAQESAPELLEWWIARLTPPPPPLDLPTDRARPAEPSFHGGAVSFDWGEDFGRSLAGLARAAGTSPWVVLLAGFQCLLHRYSGEDRIAVGVPATVRPDSGADALIGPFHNLLVLCADVSQAPTFRELVAGVAQLAEGASAHRQLPFAHLVRALKVERDPRRIPLCDAMFVSPQAPESELRLAGAQVRRRPVDGRAARADLTLTVGSTHSSVTGSLEYRAGLFERSSARAILDQLHTLLAAALATPDLPVGALPLEDEERIRAAVGEADHITGAAPAEWPVHELVRRHAERHPEAVAIAWQGTTVTYRDLVGQAASITASLRALGTVEGQAVAVRLPRGVRQIAALLGVLGAGAHLVWFGTADAGERGKAVLQDLRPTCLVLDEETAGDELSTWYRDELGGRVLDLSAPDRSEALPVPPTPPGSGLGEWAYVAYTSGSTGRPKGISQTHGAFAQFVTWLAAEFGIGPGSRVAQWVAPEHDPALCEVFATLVSGGTLCPVPERIRMNPEKLVDWLADEQITLIETVPSFAKEILALVTSEDSAGRLAALDHLLLMGEALPEELANGLRAALPFTRLINAYGPTETIAATWHEISAPVHGTVPIGRSIPGRQVLVLDELDRPCPAGVTGEIVILTPYVTPGYIGAGAGVGPAFLPVRGLEASGAEPGGCYRTGDLGRRRWDGLLEFRGRKDFQVKLLGNRVELTDVEAALAAHDSVTECAVAALTNKEGLVTRLMVYVVPQRTPSGDAAGSPEVWRAHLRRRFGKLTLPASFMIMNDRLPRNLAGKVDRRRLPDPGPLPAKDAPMPRTWAERRMAEIWSELLGTDQLSTEDTLFAVGGHSLLIPLLITLIHERFGVQLSLRECFANPSLAGLSALVESAVRNSPTTTSDPVPNASL
ncbi:MULTISPECIES: non-ribosomal peptide synthetase [Streptosporangium]|uniref:non-ribosomal peptide synthetase n=1 Tax=Streptosporangium TaxID=2000 RepID=UPI0027D928C9|nr:condensation domain-containing protein [Streptosporangium brasiliense]